MDNANTKNDHGVEEKAEDMVSKAGQATGDAVHKAGDKLEDAGDALKEKSQEVVDDHNHPPAAA